MRLTLENTLLEPGKIVREVETAIKLLAEAGSNGKFDAASLARLENVLTRISTRFAIQALDAVDFHHMDDDLSEGKLDPRYVPMVKRSIEMANPILFSPGLKESANSLGGTLLRLQAALIAGDLESSREASHQAHELYHKLQREAEDWLGMHES
ncbi:MAG: hypothetical protein HY297_05865 [Thaumarchaeota archaeon]|nr:hypothetical protein [Nitrososphaerota archaeon]